MKFFFDGKIVDNSQKVISAQDRGFLFGDGLFETLHIYNKKVFQGEQHWKRLCKSARTFSYTLPFDQAYIFSKIKQLIEINQIIEGYARITISRGIRSTPGLNMQSEGPVTCVIEVLPFSSPKNISWSLSLAKFSRSSTSLITPHKTLNYLENLFALNEAKEKGYDEALFCVENDWVQEGSRTNIFVVSEEKVFTPPLELAILPGVTRSLVIDLLKTDYPVKEEAFPNQILEKADEVFLTNSLFGIIPVSRFENHEYSDRNITRFIREKYQEYISQELRQILKIFQS